MVERRRGEAQVVWLPARAESNQSSHTLSAYEIPLCIKAVHLRFLDKIPRKIIRDFAFVEIEFTCDCVVVCRWFF